MVQLIAQHEHTVAEIMKIAGVCPANGLYLPQYRGAQDHAAVGRADQGAAQEPRQEECGRLRGVQSRTKPRIAVLTGEIDQSEVRLWVMDEHRYGLLPVIRRFWAQRGVRVHASLQDGLPLGIPARGLGI